MKHSRKIAFTLPELIVVMVLVSILGAVAIPRFGNTLKRYRCDAAAERISADLHAAARAARVASAPRRAQFNTATGVITYPEMTSLARSSQPYTVNLSREPYYVTITAVDFGGDAEVVFSGFGMPDSGGTVRISRGDESRQITMDANGSVTIQ